MRLTEARRRVLAALDRRGHATPDEIMAALAADGGSPLPSSTVYRCLDALTDLGLVSFAHLDQRSPTYHLATHADHVHLVCRSCGAVAEAPAALGARFVGDLASHHGFRADITHLAVPGLCANCLMQEGDS